MTVIQTFKPVKSKIGTTYQKSSFMRKPKLIKVLALQRINLRNA